MRPKLLKMTAFGPYAGEQVIDFDCLADANMFLIYGPTGGGKTTILDAICYALYDETNGGERSGESMRSKFADERVVTEVELYFKLREQEYHIIRRPQYERAAKRGRTGKMVKVASEVELYKKEDGGFKLLTAKYNEVSEKITELLHFNVGQFRQVIMIAQNKFRELLTVSSKERQQILQDIFETGIYQDVEKALDKMYSQSKDEVKEKELQYENDLSNIEPLGDETLNNYLATKVIHNAPQVCQHLELLCGQKQLEEEQTKNELTKLQLDLEEVQKSLLKVNQLYEAMEEKLSCQKELEAFTAKEDSYHALKEQIEKAEKTLPIIPLEEIVLELKREFEKEASNMLIYKNALQEVESQVMGCEEALKVQQGLPKQIEELKKTYSILETYKPKVEQLHIKCLEQEKESTMLRRAEEKYENLKQYTLQLKEQISAKETLLKEKDSQQVQLSDLLLKIKEVEGILKLKGEKGLKEKEANQVLEILMIKQQQIDTKQRQLLQEEERYAQAFALWFNNQAGELAKTLEEGLPCPVCGSTAHPKKALLKEGHITKEELEVIEKANKELEAQLMKLKEERSAEEKACKLIKQQLEELNKSLVDTEEVTENSYSRLQEQMTKLKEQLAYLEKLQKELEEEQKLYEEKEKAKEKGLEFIIHQKQLVSELIAYIASIKQEVPEGLLEEAALESRLSNIQKEYREKEIFYQKLQADYERLQKEQAQKSTIVREAEKRLSALKEQGVQKKGILNEALYEAGFNDLGDLKQYKMAPEALEEAKVSWQSYINRKSFLEERNKVLEEQTKDFKIEERNEVMARHNELLRGHTALSLKVNELQGYQIKHEKIIQDITKRYLQVKEVLKKQAVIEKISSYAKGKNKKGLSFERYIQSSIFEEVLRSANKKLKPMTHNRYELFRSNDLSRANAQAGLDIGIKDYYNNETRPVNTLSGGESFMAALALALGLSDVILRLAGATPLDTLFIDEGFGSLDEEALELAIKTLLNIQDTGRLIGIISHVRELREQIPVGLEITTGAKGSFAQFKL